MKSTKKRKKKVNAANVRKAVFSIIVVLIVLSFAASFFASGISSKQAAAASATPAPSIAPPPAATDRTAPESTPDANLAAFLAAIKSSMVVSEESGKNASLLVGAINAYNTLYPDDKIVSSGEIDASAIEKLKNANIYFAEISEEVEAEAWKMVVTDENGVAALR